MSPTSLKYALQSQHRHRVVEIGVAAAVEEEEEKEEAAEKKAAEEEVAAVEEGEIP